jgi:hypothetical protein
MDKNIALDKIKLNTSLLIKDNITASYTNNDEILNSVSDVKNLLNYVDNRNSINLNNNKNFTEFSPQSKKISELNNQIQTI